MHDAIDPRPDLARHQLHGAPGERWIGPVVARVEQGAERADLVAECENLIRYALRGSRDNETLDAPPGREFGIRLVGKVAHQIQHAGPRELSLDSDSDGNQLAARVARPVLSDVSLDVRAGTTVALVGATGSGKTSLVALISRLYDTSKGSVLLDGADVRSVDLASLRHAVAVVSDDPFLFSASVAENIAYGRPDASRDDVEAAARRAQAYDFVARLPHGFDTRVGERGLSLSGGQRQRLAIARALLADPRGLIQVILGGLGIVNPDAPPGALTGSHFLGLSTWDWISGPSVAMCAIIALVVWTTSGTLLLLFLAALQNLPVELDEAAMIDGASRWKRLRYVTLPQLKPVLFLVITLGLIGSWQVFDQIYVMSQGNPANTTLTPAFLSYQTAFKDFNYGSGAAISFVLFLIIVVMALIQRWVMRDRDKPRTRTVKHP